MLEKDLGTIILVGLISLGMWALAQVRMRYLATMVIAALPVLILLVFQHRYRLMRILAFLNPEEYATTYAYQLNQSLVAVGSGGLFGSGLGLGLQKYHFLSESHTDFIFAIVCEELGLIGAISICLLFALYVVIGFRISYKAPDYFSGLLAAGLTLMIGCAAFVNFFVVLGMAPTKGLPLPFFSYGGSSLLTSLAGTALLINISNYSLDMRGSRDAL
jgi:cell division protein FtsW